MRKEQRIQDQLKYDDRLFLEYGAPLESIQYQEIAQLVDDGSNENSIYYQACDLVEKEKNSGNPRAFVTSEFVENLQTLYRIWSWSK